MFRQYLVCGKAAYFKHQRIFRPAPDSKVWFTDSERGHEFFFADTRTEREVRAFDASGRIMSEAQFRALLEWLSKHKTSGNLMFVVTPAILLPRRVSTANGDPSALRSDAWDGFPESLHRLLSHIVNERIENVVFLSGDEHHSCVAKIALTSLPAQPNAGTECKPIVVRSIHSSGLYTPFILANGDESELAGNETFHFADPLHADRIIRCEVETEFMGPAMGGFTVIDCKRDGRYWRVECTFELHGRDPIARSFKVPV
jgi:cholesterol oxidase